MGAPDAARNSRAAFGAKEAVAGVAKSSIRVLLHF